MTLLQPPSFMQNRTDHTAQEDRLTLDGIMEPGTGGLAQAAGVTLVRQQTVAAMSVLVTRERFFIAGTENTHQGLYHGYNDGDITVTIAASSPTLPRKDIVVAYIQDAFYSTASNQLVVDKVTGTPNASPVIPALPNNALLLATIDVAANATTIVNANIAINAIRAYAVGGTATAVNSSAYPASPFTGQAIYDIALGLTLRWNGAWVPENRLGGPLAYRADVVKGAGNIDCGNTPTDVVSVTFPVTSGRQYRITGYGNGSQITTGGNIANIRIVDDQSGSQLIAYVNALAVSTTLLTTGTWYFTATTTRSCTCKVQGFSAVGALRFTGAGSAWILAEDMGT